MATRLLDRLDHQISHADNPFERECLKAQRAAAIARQGQLGEARFALAGLRSQSRRLRKPRLVAWVHMTDGLIDHFGSLTPAARHKFVAAREQAALADDRALQALASAWIANCDFNARHYEDMAQAIRDALQLASPQDHATLARVALVRADASRYAGLNEDAMRHYGEVHRHSVAEGDTSMISAMLHNRALFQAADIMLDDVFGTARVNEAGRTLTEIESTINLDHGLGNDALVTKTPIMRAELCATLKRWEEAVALFNAHLPRAPLEGMGYLMSRFLAQRAWCLCHTQGPGPGPDRRRRGRALPVAVG